MLEIFKELFQSNIIDSAVNSVSAIAQGLAFSLAVIFFLIHLPIVGIQSVVMLKKPVEILQMKAGNLILIVLVYAYASFMTPIESLVNYCAKVSAPSLEHADEYYEHLHAVYFVRQTDGNPSEEELAELDEDELASVKEELEIMEKTGEIPGAVEDEETGIMDMIFEVPGTFAHFLLGGIIALFIAMIKAVMVGISLVLIKLLYIFGPLAIGFSILPFMREKVVVWFGTYLTIALNLVTLNFIDMLLYNIMIGETVALQHGNTIDNFATTSFNLVMIVTYIMSFWITSKWVGSESAGRFMTAAMGMVANVAKGAVGSAIGGVAGGGAGSGGKGVGMATETIKDGLKKG